jgi:hypothetical protein
MQEVEERRTDTRVGLGPQTRFISGGASNRGGLRQPASVAISFLLSSLLNLHSFLQSDLQYCSSVRFRSHSLLPRDIADAAFVSSTGDVEE